ncbi:10813_t:CDS:2 [Rhizophagus irregularis]|nr:10813_t:CDS:2 [Rhizophagus irregularis]
MDDTIDVSGSHGHDASDGYGNGANAGQAGIGSDGGNIDVTLSSVPYSNEPGLINIYGTETYSNGHVEYINSNYNLGTEGLIHFTSVGGNGGNGGNGANGYDGYNGSNGIDATMSTIGTDVSGGIGGNPGYHGIGGKGGSGGMGGQSYSWTETIPAVYEYPSNNALTRYDPDTVDATIHFRGIEETKYRIRNTGDSWEQSCYYDARISIDSGDSNALTRYNGPPIEYYSTEETYHYDRGFGEADIYHLRQDDIYLHGTVNANYHDNFRLIEPAEPPEPPEPILIIPEEIITHTNPGGIDGDNGCDGYTPTEFLNGGYMGTNGSFEFGVINEYGKWQRRDEKFCKLEINSVECVIQNNSGIFEPGSSINVGMEIFNTGCPTPKHTPIRIELDEYNTWIVNNPKVDAPLNLLDYDSKNIGSDQGMTIKINDPKIVTNGIPLSVPINLNKFKATMTKIERPVPILTHSSISFVIQQPINISEVISIRSPGSLQYEVFWFVNNISYLSFGQDSTFKRLIRTKLTRGESTGIEIDNQEIRYIEAYQSIQITSKLSLDQDYNGIQQFTVTLQIGDNDDRPNILKSIQTRKFTIQPPLAENIPHLFLDVTKNECINLAGSNISYCKDNGSINLTLSKEIHYSVKGSIKFGDGTLILLDHNFNFDKDAFIYITQKTSPMRCDVNLITDENESHIFALIANTFEDRSNKIDWKFQTINRINNNINTYSTPFKLRVEHIIHYIDHGTKIFEPNCKGFIEKVIVFNEGEMPSPNNQDIIISLSQTSNIIPDNSFFRINKSIPYCGTFESENINLRFSIKNNENGFNNIIPLRIKDHIKFNTNIKSINHTIQNFDNFPIQEITIQYPIEMGEYLVTSVDNNIPNNVLHIKEIESLMSENYSLETTKIKISDETLLDPFNFKLYLGSIETPETLLPIQSYPFHLLPLSREDTYKKFDLVFDLNEGRLALNNQQLNDYIQPGNFKFTISTPKSKDVKVGDVEIQGKLQYTNGWMIKINERFTLDISGWIYLYTNGKDNISTGSINIKVAQEDTHLLYLIDKSCLEKCDDQLYRVIDNNRNLEYNRIYQFTLVNYDCTPADDSGIYEPGGRIVIRKIEVENTGGMPTPISHDVEISINLLNSTEISLPNDNSLKLPKPIENSVKKILSPIKSDDELCLEFQINQQSKASRDRPLNITGKINLKAIMFGINREIKNFTLPKQFNIQYPIQICPDTKIQDIPYKNITRITWRLNNIKNSLKFKTDRGLNDIFEQEISLLEAKQSKDTFCELVRTLKNQHSTVIDANLSITLFIGSIQLPDREFDIEIRNKYIEVFPSYESNSDSDVLLVANAKTTKKDTIYWDELCRKFGLSMSIWNIKREGHFDLFESSIIKDYLGKSIVILNDELNGNKYINQIINYLDPTQFYQTVKYYNIKFFVIGMNVSDQKIKELFIPIEMINSKPIASYERVKRYIKSTKKLIISEDMKYEKSEEKKFQNLKRTLDLECINTHLLPGDMNCFASEESYRMNKLRKLSKSLQKLYPGDQHIILSTISNNSDYDQITLCKTTNRTKQYLTYNSVQLDDIDDHQIERMSMIGLLSCIPFSKRLEKLRQFLFDPIQDADQKKVLKSLIEADLAMELNGLCGSNIISKKMRLMISDILLIQLELFGKFCEFVKFIISKENSFSGEHTKWALSVFAKLKILLHYSNNILFFRNNTRIYELKQIIYDGYLKAFEKCNNQYYPLLHYLKIKAKSIKKNWKNNFELKHDKKEKLKLFRGYMIGILISNNLKTDNELFNDDLDIIISDDDYKIIEQTHKNTINRIGKIKTKHQEQIELLEHQANFENLRSDSNHGIEVNNIGSAEDFTETANQGLEASNFGSEDITVITNQGLEASNFGSEDTTVIMNQGLEASNFGSEIGTENS